MAELLRLGRDHAAAVLEFERVNRAYFAASISDRGDEYFQHFAQRYQALLDDQHAGRGAYHVLVAADGSILGRFNLIMDGGTPDDGSAELGYRVAERVAGQGVATTAVRQLCRLARTRYGLSRLRAATSVQNAASRQVLTKNGFQQVGPADPADLGGKPGDWFTRELTSSEVHDE